MSHRARGVRGDGIGRLRPTTNQVLLDAIRHIRTRLDALETTYRRYVNVGHINEEKESLKEEARKKLWKIKWSKLSWE